MFLFRFYSNVPPILILFLMLMMHNFFVNLYFVILVSFMFILHTAISKNINDLQCKKRGIGKLFGCYYSSSKCLHKIHY